MKKIVHYDDTKEVDIQMGWRAKVFPIDHTSEWVSNSQAVFSSTVIRIETDGEFETLNSIYRPASKMLGALNK